MPGVDSTMPELDEVRERLEVLRERLVAAAPERSLPRIIAVTKAFPRAAIDAALGAGLTDIGESYAKECVEKLSGSQPRSRVHFIGGLQRNKVRKLADVVDVWQSVDRRELVDEIAKRAPGASIMVQVSLSDEPTKGGCAPADIGSLIAVARDSGLVVEGLMGIAPLGSPEAARPGFALLRRLVDDHGLAECSMGMSADLEVAVQEGTTMVRVGSALFGPRPPR